MYAKVPYKPHKYLTIWSMVQQVKNGSDSVVLPNAGGVLNQDWETMWAFGIIEDQIRIEREFEEKATKGRAELEELKQRLLRG